MDSSPLLVNCVTLALSRRAGGNQSLLDDAQIALLPLSQ